MISEINSVVMRRSRCRPWLDCGRCVRSLRTRIYRRSTRLMDKSQRLINLNTQAQAQATLEQSKIQNEYKSQPLCTSTAANNSIQCFSLYSLSSRTQLNIIRSHCTMYSQVYSINHIKANLDHAITPLQNEQSRWTDLPNRPKQIVEWLREWLYSVLGDDKTRIETSSSIRRLCKVNLLCSRWR